MEVNKIGSNASFGARLRVRPKDIDHVMTTIDQRCDIQGLRRIYKTIKSGETGIGSKDVLYIKDYSFNGKRTRPQDCGFLRARIDGWDYTNDVYTQASFWSLPHFFEKIQRLSKAKYKDSWTNTGNRLMELNDQFNIMCDKAIDGNIIVENSKPSRRRDFLLDAIYSLLSKK